MMPTVPVIIFTDYSDVFSEQEVRNAGISALIPKSENMSNRTRPGFALLLCRVIRALNFCTERCKSL